MDASQTEQWSDDNSMIGLGSNADDRSFVLGTGGKMCADHERTNGLAGGLEGGRHSTPLAVDVTRVDSTSEKSSSSPPTLDYLLSQAAGWP